MVSKLKFNPPLSKMDKSRNLHLPIKITEDLAYLIGVFAGDGSIGYREKKHEYSIKCVGNPKDEKKFYQKIIKPKFKKIFGITIKPKLFDKRTTFGFRIYSKSLILFLTKIMELPLGSKYNKLKIPSLIKNDPKLVKLFIRGLFDTDGCISFKKKNKEKPYYPVISFSSNDSKFTKEINKEILKYGFKTCLILNYKLIDSRVKKGFTIINRIELNGKTNFKLWLKEISFFSPKHLKKIKSHHRNGDDSGEKI